MESTELNLQKLAYFGARERIKSLVREKHKIDEEIKNLKKFLKSGKQKFVEEVKRKYTKRGTALKDRVHKKRKLSKKGLEALRRTAANARAAKAAKRERTLSLLVK